MLTKVLAKQGFNVVVQNFFKDYIKDRQTTFLFNSMATELTNFMVGVGQGSALSPILTNLYIAPAIQIAAKEIRDKFPGSELQFFVDDGLI